MLNIQPRNKIAEVEPLLDKIVMQNDQILLWQQRRNAVLNDVNNNKDDLGISKIIDRCEGVQQKCAEQVAEIDNRGTVRARMLCDYIRTLSMPHIPEDVKRLAKNRMIVMGLISIYRLHPPKQTKLVSEMLGKLPTTGRDYSRYEW